MPRRDPTATGPFAPKLLSETMLAFAAMPVSSHADGPGRPVLSRNSAAASCHDSVRPSLMIGSLQYCLF